MSNHLYIVGTGIKCISHLTTETKAHITNCDKVLYLLNDPLMKEWIQENNPNSESLDFLYRKYAHRYDCYQEISNYIIDVLDQTHNLCIVMYGHPTVLFIPSILSAQIAQQKKHFVKILPGISSEACLFSDLMIDPSQCGLLSYEATDFLLYDRLLDPTSNVVLWQIASIGALVHTENHHNSRGIQLLVDKLLEFYSEDHQMYLYEAAQLPQCEPNIELTSLKNLTKIPLTPITTLYIPPFKTKAMNQSILAELQQPV